MPLPALVSTLAICIVFVPMFFLSGVARYLFVPMAEAVVFAMLASYLLSRTLVPTMAKYLLLEHDDAEVPKSAPAAIPWSVSACFRIPALSRLRHGYLRLLTLCMDHSAVFLIIFLVFALGSVGFSRALAGPGLLPFCRLRPVQDSRARPHRHAH